MNIVHAIGWGLIFPSSLLTFGGMIRAAELGKTDWFLTGIATLSVAITLLNI